MKFSIIRLLALCSLGVLSMSSSCDSETEQLPEPTGPVNVQVRYTATGINFNNTDSPMPNVAIGHAPYRSCYTGSCQTGTRDVLNIENVRDGVYTQDLGMFDPKTTTLYVAPWFRQPVYRPLRTNTSLKVEILIQDKVVSTVTLGAGDTNNPAYFTDTDDGRDLLKEEKLEWPK